MRIMMLQTMDGSPDGVTVNQYRKGETYDVPDSLGTVFLKEKWAERAKAKPDAEENKQRKGPKENK